MFQGETSRHGELFLITCSPLKLSLDLYYTEDEIYELSYTREPKNCKAHVSYKSSFIRAAIVPCSAKLM